MPHIKTDSGIEWNYDIEGEGTWLLFIHGWGVDKRIWRQQSKYFSHAYRVLTIDLPGHGESSWKKISFKAMAEDLKTILKILNISQLSIVGSSIGGLLALRLYEIVPAAIKKISFTGSTPKFAKSADFCYIKPVGPIVQW